MSSAKRYEQYCPVARSLDVLGERWTLLVIRGLVLGPQRYTDLRDSMPGIASDLLTARLRTLVDAGYVQRRELPRPAPATIYELTDAGWRVARVVLALARVGLERLGAPQEGEQIKTSAFALILRASFRAEQAGEDDRCYEVVVDGEPLSVAIEAGQVRITHGPAEQPICTISTSARKLAEVLSGAAEPEAAIADGELRLEGPASAFEAFLGTFSYARAAEATPA